MFRPVVNQSITCLVMALHYLPFSVPDCRAQGILIFFLSPPPHSSIISGFVAIAPFFFFFSLSSGGSTKKSPFKPFQVGCPFLPGRTAFAVPPFFPLYFFRLDSFFLVFPHKEPTRRFLLLLLFLCVMSGNSFVNVMETLWTFPSIFFVFRLISSTSSHQFCPFNVPLSNGRMETLVPPRFHVLYSPQKRTWLKASSETARALLRFCPLPPAFLQKVLSGSLMSQPFSYFLFLLSFLWGARRESGPTENPDHSRAWLCSPF